MESPQAPEDDSQQRYRCAWEAHELIIGPPQAEALTLRGEGRASEPYMFRRLLFLRAESAAVRLRHSGHMLPASEVGMVSAVESDEVCLVGFLEEGLFFFSGRVVYKAVKRGWVSDGFLFSRRNSAARVDESNGTLG